MARKKIDNQYYINYVGKCWKESDDAIRPSKKVWEELWQLYQNKQDWSKKASWQSKNFIPKVFMQVEKSSGEVKRALIQTKKLFKFELDDQREREGMAQLEESLTGVEPNNVMQMGFIAQQIKNIKRLISNRERRMFIREKSFKRSIQDSNLTNIYSEMSKCAFLLGLGVPKVLWDESVGGCTYENVDIMNLRIHPEYRPFSRKRPKYVIERIEMDLAEFRKEVRGHKKLYIKDEVAKIEQDAPSPDEKLKRRTRQNLGDYTPVSSKVVLKQFWGDVVNEDNDDIEENMLLVVANDKYLVRKQPNPFRHGLAPYILTMPLVYPHRGVAGVPLVAPQVRMQYTLNNIVNAYLDNLNFVVNKMYQYNPSSLSNPQMMTAIYPGKRITHNLPGSEQAVQEVAVTPLGKDALMAFDLIKSQMEEASNVNEFISGTPGKKSKTLGEVELKTAQTRGLFDVIARDLEANSLKPLLEMSYDLHEQFGGYEPRKGNYTFSVGGISLLITQKEVREGVAQCLAMALQAPPLAQMTDIADLWHKFLSNYNLADVYKEPQVQGELLSMQQSQGIQAKAEQDAKATVAQMSPEEIKKRAG